MLNDNKGFTLVEILFVFSIIIVCTTLILRLQQPYLENSIYIQNISDFIYMAKLTAITKKKEVIVHFNKHNIIVESSSNKKIFQLNKNCFFHEHIIAFNEYGHIIHPKTVYFYCKNNVYKFIFQIGSGCFYIEAS